MSRTVLDGTASPQEGPGRGVEVAVSFPFLAAPREGLFGREAALPHGFPDPALREPHEALAERILRRLPGSAPSRAYVGSETCARLVPSPRALEGWISAASAAGWGVSLVLPPLTREAQERALTSLRVLSSVPGAEMVANDWGTIHLARKRFPGLSIVLGRLTHKMLRDPRLAEYFDSPGAPRAARSALCRSGELAHGFRALMERYGLRRREIDPFLQPLEDSEWEGRTEKLSVHLPYLFVTMGRSCLPGAMHREKKGRFVPDAPCRTECRRHAIEFQLPGPGANGGGKRFLGLGNAFYHAVPPPVMDRILALLPKARGVDRIVLTLPVAKAGKG